MSRLLLAVLVVACVSDAFPAGTNGAEPVVRLIYAQPVHGYPLADTNHVATLIVKSRDAVLTRKLADGEALWGFGERFDAWNLRGRVVESWTRDKAQGGPNSSYFAVPFFISSAGYGLFVNCSGKVVFDCGATKPDELRIEVPEAGLDVFLFKGTPREILQQYTKLVGRPQPVPDWVFEPWLSRNSYVSAYEIDRVIEKMEQHKLKAGVVVLEAWAQSLQNFQFEQRRYPNPKEWIEKLRARGYRVVLWETPGVLPGASTYTEAKTNGWLVLNEDGSEYVTDWLENGRKIDFRKPEARAWWTKLHEPLVAMGVAGFKTDGGERAPDPWFHNLHPYYYQRAVLEAFASAGQNNVTIVTQFWQRGGVVFARAASPPCAGNSLFWAGDQHADWRELRRVVRAGLSAALSGFAFWGHDIGGYAGTPTKKLYIRWLQLGAFSPIMQFHGVTPREPWYFDDETVRIAKVYFDLRAAMLPYIVAAAKQSREQGVPIWRALLYEFPDDAATHAIDDQFMFGDDLLVAPILSECDARKVYLPAGEWVDAWTGQKHSGPTNLFYTAELSVIPVFMRNGRVLPVTALPRPAVELAGSSLRIWRGQKYEKIFLHVRDGSEITLGAPPGFEVLPAKTQRGERVAFYVMWPDDCPVGTYAVKAGTVALELVKLPDWKLPVRDDGYVDLGKESEATATFRSDRGGRARLWLGSGDGMTVWLNGEQVFDKQMHRNAERDEDFVDVDLKRGENTIRVQLTHGAAAIGRNGFYFRVSMPE
jgi:alpha-D-xyloside xylohydrolase